MDFPKNVDLVYRKQKQKFQSNQGFSTVAHINPANSWNVDRLKQVMQRTKQEIPGDLKDMVAWQFFILLPPWFAAYSHNISQPNAIKDSDPDNCLGIYS